MAVCRRCNNELPKQERGYITFHVCKAPHHGEWKSDEQLLAERMVEGSTEYDWDEIPGYIQLLVSGAARQLLSFMEQSPIMGEVVTEQRELQPWVQKELDQIMKDMGIE